jgi:hypothetical protein
VGFLHRSAGVGRQVAAIALIFALVLQSLALSLAAGRLAAASIGAIDWAGFEICRHDPGSSGAPGGAPTQPASDQHCVFCIVGASHAVGAPITLPTFHVIEFAVVAWPFVAWRLPTLTVNASARSRGPPSAV